MTFPHLALMLGVVLGLTSGTAKAAVYDFDYVTASNLLGDPISASGRLDLTPDPAFDRASIVATATGEINGSIIKGLDGSFTPLIFDGPTGKDDEIVGFTTAAGVTYYFAHDVGLSSAGDLDRGDFTVSAVPLPAAGRLFGAALLALGALGHGLRRTTSRLGRSGAANL